MSKTSMADKYLSNPFPAWELIEDGSTQMDAVEQAISESCELNWCSNSVGPYHKVDEQGDVTLDAMMIDG